MLPEWFNKAVELYNKEFSYKRIGEELKIDRKKIAKVLKENGYAPKYVFNNKGKLYRKYTFNENFFENIDSEEKAYWLGFLYADGYVNSQKTSIELGLQESDLGHLERFREDIDGNMPLTKTSKTIDGKTYIGYRLTANSFKFKQDLISKGCVENKSKILIFPNYNQVPKYLMNHFIRGYIDGDGCIYKKYNNTKSGKKICMCVEIIGTEPFLKELMNEVGMQINTVHSLRKDNDNVKRTQYNGIYANQFLDYLYKDATVYLNRKYVKLPS